MKSHPVQDRLKTAVERGVRFPVVPAGRRSGKSEIIKRKIAKFAMDRKNAGKLFFLAAPTRDQVRRIFWDDMKLMTFSPVHKKRPSESHLTLFMPSGAEIQLIGMDKPERFEGTEWHGGALDEIANIKENAWAENILPALNTVNPTNPDYRAFCYLIGVPEGLTHYYEMAEYAKTANDPNWELFHWVSADILPPDVIEDARRVMSEKQFKQEFEASFETAGGRIYDDYGQDNYTDREIKPHEQLWWCHDQNFTPMSSAVCVNDGKAIYILDEIILTSAVSRQTAVEFVEKFKDHKNKHVIIYGDPAGRAGEKHGHASDYIEIEKVLKASGWTFKRKVARKHPAIKNRQNAVRAKIRNAAGEVSLFVNPSKAKYAHKGLSTCQVKEGSTFQEEETEYQHITTAIGYMIHVEYPSLIKPTLRVS